MAFAAFFGQIGLPGFCRPRHHVNVGMIAFIVEGSVPAEVIGMNLHCIRDLIVNDTEQVVPRRGVIVTETDSMADLIYDVSALQWPMCVQSAVFIHLQMLSKKRVSAPKLRPVFVFFEGNGSRKGEKTAIDSVKSAYELLPFPRYRLTYGK